MPGSATVPAKIPATSSKSLTASCRIFGTSGGRPSRRRTIFQRWTATTDFSCPTALRQPVSECSVSSRTNGSISAAHASIQASGTPLASGPSSRRSIASRHSRA